MDVATILFVVAVPAPDPVPLAFRSPDLSGDLAVNLTDITLFTQILLGGGEVWRCDYNLDQQVNLTDVVIFTPAIGVVCP